MNKAKPKVVLAHVARAAECADHCARAKQAANSAWRAACEATSSEDWVRAIGKATRNKQEQSKLACLVVFDFRSDEHGDSPINWLAHEYDHQKEEVNPVRLTALLRAIGYTQAYAYSRARGIGGVS